MSRVISFRVSGETAAFRDPSVNTSQSVCYIPSKTAAIGMIGAVLGVQRGHGVAENYSDDYLKLFQATRIGIELESRPEKVSFFTNHRSLKEAKTKPFKTELILRPRYRMYVQADEETMKKLFHAMSAGECAYPPYLGHAYCPATISEPSEHEATRHQGANFMTSAVMLDESETYDDSFSLTAEASSGSTVIVERHLHHFMEGGKLQARVLKHWIPVNGSLDVTITGTPKLSETVALDKKKIVCLY